MSLRSKVRLSAILSVLVLASVGISLALSLQASSAIQSEQRIATNILQEVLELNAIAYDYVQYRDDQSRAHWMETHASLNTLLTDHEFSSSVDHEVVRNLRRDHEALQVLFELLTQQVPPSSGDEISEDLAFNALETRLVGQLGIASQQVAATAFKLSEELAKASRSSSQKTSVQVLLFVGLLAGEIVAIWWWITTGVLAPITKIREGAGVIGKGDLDHRLDLGRRDELGDLSRAFDDTMLSLKSVMASRDDLEREVMARERAEEEKAKRENQIRRELSELEHIYDSATVGLCLMDTELRYLRINKWLADINGVPPEDHIGRSFKEIIPQVADLMEEVYAKVIETGEPVLDITAAAATPAQPETLRHYTASYYPLKSDEGEIWGLGSIVRDVTEEQETQRQLESTNARTRAILDNALNAIVSMNEKGVIEEFNPEASELFGYRASEVVGKNVKMLMPDAYAREHDGYLQNYITTGKAKIIGLGREVTAKRKDDSEFPISLWVSEYFLNEERKFVGVVQDLTAQKAHEEELRHAKESAEEANKAKSLFLSGMSHELRTPLHAILGFGELMSQELDGPLNDDQRDFMSHIETSGKHLLELITDLLDVSKIDAGVVELDIDEVDVGRLLKSSKNMEVGPVREKDLAIDVKSDGDLRVMGDQRRCQQILTNLLSNAVKFSPSGGRILLSAVQQGEDSVYFAVRDSGPGIALDQQEEIFSEFHQADHERDTSLGGSGIGLALARRLVNLHGGEIGVESKLGVGSTFWFTLPRWNVVSSTEESADSR